MGWGSTKTHCQCNGSNDAPARVQECVPSKELLSACSSIITAAVKSTCGARRMFVSAVVLIFLFAAIYWLSMPHGQATPLRRPVTPCQNVPVQTSQYNFPTYQQRQTNTQQIQTAACGPCFGVPQEPYSHTVVHRCTPVAMGNPCQTVLQSPCCLPPVSHLAASCAQLPANILDQIRACVSNAAPIFILPGNCQQSAVPQQQQQQQQQQQTVSPQAPSMPTSPTAYPPTGLTYPAACYPPPFYPYLFPLSFCDTFFRAKQTGSCGCCRRKDVDASSETARQVARLASGCHYESVQDEHHCMPTTDDTICSKRSCPSSLHLQALASQFLSMQGIISCAATRLVLRKVAGSNVTTSMEDTMARAQKAISVLTKDQLLSESRNAQQVNALINLHMTANPPPNVIPILTLVQLKMNLLKAQVEGLVNQRLMETQGVGVEVEIDLIDPTILALKSDAELRDLLSALRQKECDERVNVNFAPYRSQRAIAETRLRNVQNKIRQVEAEFDRRRCAILPTPTLSSRIVQQFSAPCHSVRFEDPRKLYSTLPPDPSPDPFAKTRSPKRLVLKPCTSRRNPEAATQAAEGTGTDPPKEPSAATDRGTSMENCACDEAKKKLRPWAAEMIYAPGGETATRVRGAKRRRAKERAAETPREKIPRTGNTGRELTDASVTYDKSAGTLMESEGDVIILGERIDTEDVCESPDAIATRNTGRSHRIMDRERSGGGSTDFRQSEERAAVEITISGRTTEEKEEEDTIERDSVRVDNSRSVPPSKTEKWREAVAMATAEVADDDRISSAWESKQMSSASVHTSPSRITSTPGREEREAEEKRDNGEILPLSSTETTECGANEVSLDDEEEQEEKKRIKFYVASLLTNIAHDENRGCQKRREIDERIATSGKETGTADPDIEKLHEYSSTDDPLRDAVAHKVTEGDRAKNIFSAKLNFSEFRNDRQCQTVLDTVGENEGTPVASLRAHPFPPLKYSHGYATNNEKNGDTAETRRAPTTKTEVTVAERLFPRDTSSALYESKASFPSPPTGVKCNESSVPEMFSVIGNRVANFVGKIITLNGKLLCSSREAILCKTRNIDILRKAGPIRDQSDLILKDYDPLGGILHYPLDPAGTPTTGKHNFRDMNLSRVSTAEGHRGMYSIRHSIIENKDTGARYLLIGALCRDLTSARDLERPYKVRRSSFIRSRLESGLSNSRNRPRPFVLFKRTGKRVPQSCRTQSHDYAEVIEGREVCELRGSEKFCTLPEILKAGENHDAFKVVSSGQYNSDCEESRSNEHLINDNIFNKQEYIDSELMIKVHNYLV